MDEKRDLIKSYDNLAIEDKRIELEREIEEISLIMQELLTDLNPDYPIKDKNKLDYYKEAISEDNYLTNLYEDVIDLKEKLGEYCDFATNLYYDDDSDMNFDNKEYLPSAGFIKLGIISLLSLLLITAIIILGVMIV